MSEVEAIKYEIELVIPALTTTRKTTGASSTSQYFKDAIFISQNDEHNGSISNEIAWCPGEKVEARDMKVFDFWKKTRRHLAWIVKHGHAYFGNPSY